MNSIASEAYEIAVRLLARREHSRHELKQKLIQRGITGREIESTLNKLSKDGYQSDDRYVEVCIRSQLRKGHGPLKIRAYLQNHGIQSRKIGMHLSTDDEFWFKRALEADEKCRGRNQISEDSAVDHEAIRVRARYLSNRGFPANVISRILNSPTDRTTD